MKCHYSHDDEGNKFWYPQCAGGAVYGPHACTCRYYAKRESSEATKDKKIIKELEKELATLNRIIGKLKKSHGKATSRH